MNLLYSNIQNYAWILERARCLLESAEETDRVGRQINRRIYNNAFCSMMRLHFSFELEGDDKTGFLKMVYDGHEYRCPVSAAKTILRDCYESVLEKQRLKEKISDKSFQPKLITEAISGNHIKESDKLSMKSDHITGKPDHSEQEITPTEEAAVHGKSVAQPAAITEKQIGMIVVSSDPYQYGDDPDINVHIEKGDYKNEELLYEYQEKGTGNQEWKQGMPALPGEYAFCVSAKETDHTKAAFAVCMVTVEKRKIDIKADAVSKEYDGNTNADAQVDIVNVVNGDSVEVDYTASFDAPNPGDRHIIVHINKLTGADAGKYMIGEQNEFKMMRKILPRPDSVTTNNAAENPTEQKPINPKNLHTTLQERKKHMIGAGVSLSAASPLPDWDDFEFSKPKPKNILDLDAQTDIDMNKNKSFAAEHGFESTVKAELTENKKNILNVETGQKRTDENLDSDTASINPPEEDSILPNDSKHSENGFDVKDTQPKPSGSAEASEETAPTQKETVLTQKDTVPEEDGSVFLCLNRKEAAISGEVKLESEPNPISVDAEPEGSIVFADDTQPTDTPVNHVPQEIPSQIGLFHPKHVEQHPTQTKEPEEEPVKEPKAGLGLLSRFMGRGRTEKELAETKSEDEVQMLPLTDADNKLSVPDLFVPRTPVVQSETSEPVIVKNDWSGKTEAVFEATEPDEKDYTHDGGILFHHVHQVVLQKKFGSNSVGPYRFVFWPIWIYDRYVGRRLADFLVHVTDPNGNERVSCTEGDLKELLIEFDGIQFKAFATWNDGVFESKILLNGRTDSIYKIEDSVHKEEPEHNFSNTYLDQFRLERKGQPKHFIVPFKNNNRGEKNTPIIGYVEVNRKRYPLERRDGNTLSYRYSGGERIIKGHWEDGTFQFSVEDANRL